MDTNGENGTKETAETGKKLNAFVWIGFALDLIGFFMALFMDFYLGVAVIVIGLVFSIIGLIVCIRQKGNVATAVLYVVLDVAFLIYLLVIY